MPKKKAKRVRKSKAVEKVQQIASYIGMPTVAPRYCAFCGVDVGDGCDGKARKGHNKFKFLSCCRGLVAYDYGRFVIEHRPGCIYGIPTPPPGIVDRIETFDDGQVALVRFFRPYSIDDLIKEMPRLFMFRQFLIENPSARQDFEEWENRPTLDPELGILQTNFLTPLRTTQPEDITEATRMAAAELRAELGEEVIVEELS